jgi:dienelactone hydrolase
MYCNLAPLYIVAPTIDELFSPQQRARTEELLQQSGKGSSIQVYSNVSHGFAVSVIYLEGIHIELYTNQFAFPQTRADLEDSYVNWAKEQCFGNFVEWFDFWLAKD